MTLKQLHGFLGLTGYYRRFIKGYGKISKPLTELLKKGVFVWSREALDSFEALKAAIVSAPVLALPDFKEEFVETDASREGIGVVLVQRGQPIAFISASLSPRTVALSVYDKELLALIYAVDKWRPYLMGRHFTILNDHQSLKYLLEQRIISQNQLKWLTKLMGYDYDIVYKRGKENLAADALSRALSGEITIMVVNVISSDLLERVRKGWEADEGMQRLIKELEQDPNRGEKFTWSRGKLRWKGKLIVYEVGD